MRFAESSYKSLQLRVSKAWVGRAASGRHGCKFGCLRFLAGKMRRSCRIFGLSPILHPPLVSSRSHVSSLIQSAEKRPNLHDCVPIKRFSMVHKEEEREESIVIGPSGEEERLWSKGDPGSSQPWHGARVPLAGWQKAAVAVGSAVGALMNPARADLVAALGETTGSLAFDNMLKRMRRSVEGQKVLSDRPRVTSVSMARAWDMPSNTFGAAYAKFMGDRNFSPDDRPPVRFLESEELAYVATRSREVHDFWHVLFNLPTSVMGELALKMVEFHQTGLPMCFLSVAGASWRLKPQQRYYLFTHYTPWALKAGTSASDLMCIYYEKHMHEDLDEVRKKWGVLPAPPLPKKRPL